MILMAGRLRSNLNSIWCILSASLIIGIALDACKSCECYTNNRNNNHKVPSVNRHSINRRVSNQQQQVAIAQQEYSQSQMKSDDYEKLSQEEEKAIIDNNGRSKEQTKNVIPSKDSDGNSQVVYVNLARVVKDGNKTETTRLVDNNEQLIKQDGQISCGETNRNGNPSLVVSTPEAIQNRIVGGVKAEPGEFPFQVRLNIRSRRGSSLCGGVIIDQRHILTAAHCMTTW